MIKLQQFEVFSFKVETITKAKNDLSMTLAEARENDMLISLGDSEVLRVIRRITNHPYSKDRLVELLKERKDAKKLKWTEGWQDTVRELNARIDEQLFIPDFLSVEFPNTREYDKLNEKGFKVNGIEYTWLMCGAGHQRTNRAMYVNKGIYEPLDEILRNGSKVKEIVLAKYNAYYALSSSSTYRVRRPRVCVIDDCEIKMTKLVDFVSNGEITRCEREMAFNLFDGQGLISPEFSELWAKDVGIRDYIPSAWGVRCSFIKGMCVTFDFHTFARDIAKTETIKDIWGKEYLVSEIDLIISKSQFKLWNAYEDWQDYENNLIKNGLSWGVSKVSPRVNEEKTVMTTNYQFLQVLNLSDEDIKGLCDQTVDWLKSVSCGDINKTKLYLLGSMANKYDAETIFQNVQDNFVKCLLMEDKMIEDEYIRSRIVKSINKKIRESYFGNLIVDGNFMARISDPYAQCEFAFGMEVKGLLEDKRHYSWYWAERGVDSVVAMRSPLTYKTEAHLLKFKNDIRCQMWYKYLTSGIVYNVWGVDCLLEAGADYDFDIVATTNNKYFIKGILGTDIPVTYEARKPSKRPLDRNELIKIAGVGFSPEIGLLTNHSTTFHDMQSRYEKGTEQWNELERRLKICCEQQSMQIDKAKGLVIDDIPKYWTNYKSALEKDGGERGLNCELLIEKRPYFMRYRYRDYNKQYKDMLSDKKMYCEIVFGNSDGQGNENSEEFAQMEKYYNKRCNLSFNNGIMNKICRYMEENLKEIKSKKKVENVAQPLNDIMGGGDNNGAEKEQVLGVWKSYLETKQQKKLEEKQCVTWEQYFKKIRNYCMENISPDLVSLARHAYQICYIENPKKAKDFLWDCFGEVVRGEFEKYYIMAQVPEKDESGGIEYLGKKYIEKTVYLRDYGEELGEIDMSECNDLDSLIYCAAEDDEI